MTYKRFFLISTVSFIVISLLAAFLTFVRAGIPWSEPRVIGRIEADKRRQAAPFTVGETPFYYPFKSRPSINMNTLFPFTKNFGYVEKQDSQGFWTPEYTTTHPPKTFRILIIGNGLTNTINLPMEETYPYLMAEFANQRCTDFHIEVISLSVSGHKMAQELIKLFAHGQYLKPDLVVFQVYPADIEVFSYLGIFHILNPGQEFILYSEKYKKLFEEDSLDWKVYSESLIAIQNWSKDKNVPIAFLVFPPIDSGKTGHNFRQYDAQTMDSGPAFQTYPKFVSFTQQYFPTLDLIQTFRKEAGDRYLAGSEVFGGLNEYAHRLIARALLTFLKDRNLVHCDRTRLQPPDPLWTQEKAIREEAEQNWMKYNTSLVEQLHYYQKLHQLIPKNPWITYQLADVNLLLAKREDAAPLYNSLLDQAPGIAVPWYQMAACTRNPKRRLDLFEKMVQNVPDHIPSMQGLLTYYTPEKSCKVLKRLLEIPVSREQYKANKNLYEKYQCDQLLQQSR
jgi:hypothetical protein